MKTTGTVTRTARVRPAAPLAAAPVSGRAARTYAAARTRADGRAHARIARNDAAAQPAGVVTSAARPVDSATAFAGPVDPVATDPTTGEDVVDRAPDRRTRDQVVALLLARGSATAAELGAELDLSPAAIRRHLDAMLAHGLVEVAQRPSRGPRGRGRPAKAFRLTEAAREGLNPHTYDDIATAALRWIAQHGGETAVAAFAAEQVAGLEERCQAAVAGAGEDPLARAEALARALTAEGYAAGASTIASGGQLCQHHCPVAHVAAEFPQLCEAETQVISRLVGTHVQRLATIAHGDGVCTTHIPRPTDRRSVQVDPATQRRSVQVDPATQRRSVQVDPTPQWNKGMRTGS